MICYKMSPSTASCQTRAPFWARCLLACGSLSYPTQLNPAAHLVRMRFVLRLAILGVACGVPIAPRSRTSLSSGECPSYVSLTNSDSKSKYSRLQVDDEYCDKNCRAGYCPKDKCRCSTDHPEPAAPKPSDKLVKEKVATPEAASEEEAIAGNCPKFVSLNGNTNSKSKFSQGDDAYCEKNCRAGFCPETRCRCTTDPESETSDEDAADAMAAAPQVAPTAPVVPKKESDDDACAKYVSLVGDEDGTSKFNQVDDDWCNKNCRGNFLSCPKDKCRCFTDPEPAAQDDLGDLVSDAAAIDAARAADRAAINHEAYRRGQQMKDDIVQEKVATPEAASEEEAIARNCPKFVSLNGNTSGKSKFSQGDDAYCEKNCRAGFCPETRCRCTTDPESETSNEDAADAMAAAPLVAPTPMPVAPLVAPTAAATPKDDCPSYVSNRPPAGDEKGPFNQVDDAYCEKNCRAGFCPQASCRCSTEPAPEAVVVDEAAGSSPARPFQPVKWWKNQQTPPHPAQPIPWWKTAKTGKKSDVTGDDFADDGASWEQQNRLGSEQEITDDSWLEGAEVYEEGTDEGPTK